jgi:uncharacterized protein YndB with AHSA1/START domain
MLKIIGIAAVVLVVAAAGVLAYAATKPDTFRVERSATIKAPPERIFALINDLRGWNAWSPYEKKDPDMKRTFSGPASGPGAVYAWDGDKNVGQGRMEITEASTPSKIVIKLDFLRPFEAHNTAEFTMVPQADSTKLTWAMHGPNLFAGKVISTFINIDRMVGNDFEAGLANLKTIAEK